MIKNDNFNYIIFLFFRNKVNYKWAKSGKQNWRCGMNQMIKLKCLNKKIQGYHEKMSIH